MTPSTEHVPTDKATLYCPECGHESHVDGDWTIHNLDGITTYACPDCGTTIESRCTRTALIAGGSGSVCVAED